MLTPRPNEALPRCSLSELVTTVIQTFQFQSRLMPILLMDGNRFLRSNQSNKEISNDSTQFGMHNPYTHSLEKKKLNFPIKLFKYCPIGSEILN